MTSTRWVMLALLAACHGSDTGAVPDGSVGNTGVCADGFVRCDGLCIEDSLVGPACAPKICERGVGGSPTPAQLGARGIAHQLAFAGGSAHFAVTTGAASAPLTATTAVELTYRRNGGPIEHAALSGSGTAWQVDITGTAGDVLDYYFTQKVGPNTFHPGSPHTEPSIDTAWFRRMLGAPPPAPPAYPLRVEIGSRFRDRHRNEWRYDHYVGGYDAGAAYTLTLVDRGDALDVIVVPDPAAKVGKIDLKWYEVFGPTPFCNDPPALAGLAAPGAGMLKSGNTFTYTIPNLVEGQLVDLELTLTDLVGPVLTYYSEWLYYRVGTGTLGRRDQHPWAYAAGDAAVSDVTVHQFAFAQHVPNTSAETLADFLAGKIIFDTALDTGMLVNPPTTYDCRGTQPLTFPPSASPMAATLSPALGPDPDAVSCTGCHRLDGRGLSPVGRSMRIAPPVFGLGLVEAVADATILGLADPDDADHDGISGRASIVIDGRTGKERLGRYGWTASQPTIEQQIAKAFAVDMGVGSSLHPALGIEISDEVLAHATAYIRALSPPPRTNHRDPAALRGKALFEAARCNACHVPNLVTASNAEPAELAGQVIQPFSDFLLHDLGDALVEPATGNREWRTSPLWGLGFADHALGDAASPSDPNRVAAVARYLHDGRARTLIDAILAHGGEAEAARNAVLALSAAQRDDLIAYVRYPFADPPLVGCR